MLADCDLRVVVGHRLSNGGFNFEVQQKSCGSSPIRGEMFIERATAKKFLLAPAERKMSQSPAQCRTACGSKQMPRPRLQTEGSDAMSKLKLASACYRKAVLPGVAVQS